MATASIRKTAMTKMVTLLKTVTAGATYFRSLNVADNVSTRVRLLQSAQEGKSFIWVRPGNEDIRRLDLSSQNFEATFEILLEVAVKDATSYSMVEELEDLLHDISLCLGDDRTLTGTVVDTVISRIEAPNYGIDDFFGITTVHVICTYDFEYGSSI